MADEVKVGITMAGEVTTGTWLGLMEEQSMCIPPTNSKMTNGLTYLKKPGNNLYNCAGNTEIKKDPGTVTMIKGTNLGQLPRAQGRYLNPIHIMVRSWGQYTNYPLHQLAVPHRFLQDSLVFPRQLGTARTRMTSVP